MECFIIYATPTLDGRFDGFCAHFDNGAPLPKHIDQILVGRM